MLMILRSSPASPFGRKVKIAAHVLGLIDKIDIIVADTLNPEDPLRTRNPLGKIPALTLDDGTTLYDSRVIVEYLDHVAGGGKIIPETGKERFEVLTLQALADGVMDAALLQVYETRFRDEDKRSSKWVEHQSGKVTRGLDALEVHVPHLSPVPNLGAITVACALGYLDLRFGEGWRTGRPRLTAWLADFAARVPGYAATMPH
jgi:glutathione S-transferase